MDDLELDAMLKRAFAKADAADAQNTHEVATDPAFLARVSAGVANVERQRRWARGALALAFALAVLAVTPIVVQLSLALVLAALSPAGALTAVCLSLGAVGLVLKRTLA